MIFSINLKTVIELFPTTHYPNCYLRTAQVKGVKNYYALIHDAVIGLNKDPESPNINWLFDYNVNIPEILKILDSLER